MLINFIITIVIGIVAAIIHLPIFTWLYDLAILLPVIALTVRRIHDSGNSGWWALILLIPLIGVIVLFIFTLLDSQPGPNQYGPNPKGVQV